MIGQFNFPDANIDARDHGGKKPIHMLSHKASERTRSKSGRPCTQPYTQGGQEVYRFLLAIGQRTCVWWKCSWCVCSPPPQFYWQDSTPTVCLWEVEQSPGLAPWLFPLQRAGEQGYFVTFPIPLFCVLCSRQLKFPTTYRRSVSLLERRGPLLRDLGRLSDNSTTEE